MGPTAPVELAEMYVEKCKRELRNAEHGYRLQARKRLTNATTEALKSYIQARKEQVSQ